MRGRQAESSELGEREIGKRERGEEIDGWRKKDEKETGGSGDKEEGKDKE